MRLKRHRRQNQRGYALLLVFAMAAAAVVMLYLEMPRVAFEHERNKEALLVERGDQYVRAIQLYYKKYSKYPQTIEDLETTNNIRFLRRRYKDPMTNSDEWRLIHVDGTGQYTDSLIHKKNNDQQKNGPSVLSSNIVGVGASAEYVDQANQGQSAAALTRRASDRIIPGSPGAGSAGAQTEQPADPAQGDPNTSRSGPASPPQPPGFQSGNPFAMPQNGQQPGRTVVPGSGPTGNPGQNPVVPGQQNGTGGSGSSGGSFGFGGGFGSSSNSNSSGSSNNNPNTGNQNPNNQGGFGGSGFGGSGSGGSGNSGFGGFGNSNRPGPGNAAPNQAISAIQNMLTNPNAGNPNNNGFGANNNGSNGLAAGAGGLVGVASKRDMEGILVYNERTNVKEWEFVFDQKKAANGQGQLNPQQQGQGQGQGQNPNQQNGSSGFSFGGSGSSSGSSGGFGSNRGSGSSSGFGSSGFGSGSSFGSSGSSGSSGGASSGFGGFGSSGSTGTPAPGKNN